MLRVWGLVRKNNKIVKDMVAEYLENDIKEIDALHKCIEDICYEFDLQRPLWFPKNQRFAMNLIFSVPYGFLKIKGNMKIIEE